MAEESLQAKLVSALMQIADHAKDPETFRKKIKEVIAKAPKKDFSASGVSQVIMKILVDYHPEINTKISPDENPAVLLLLQCVEQYKNDVNQAKRLRRGR